MITPLEIRKLEFTKAMRGYDEGEVKSSLDSISKEFEALQRENVKVIEKLKIAEERINHFKLIEKTLQDSVITMQTMLEEKRRSAEQEARLIIQEAKMKADNEVKDYLDRVTILKNEINVLENQRTNYFIRFKNFCNSQMDWLKSMEKNEDPLS